jgi:hypothetical protein
MIESKIKSGFHIILMAKLALTKANLKDIVTDLDSFFVKNGLIK